MIQICIPEIGQPLGKLASEIVCCAAYYLNEIDQVCLVETVFQATLRERDERAPIVRVEIGIRPTPMLDILMVGIRIHERLGRKYVVEPLTGEDGSCICLRISLDPKL